MIKKKFKEFENIPVAPLIFTYLYEQGFSEFTHKDRIELMLNTIILISNIIYPQKHELIIKSRCNSLVYIFS